MRNTVTHSGKARKPLSLAARGAWLAILLAGFVPLVNCSSEPAEEPPTKPAEPAEVEATAPPPVPAPTPEPEPEQPSEVRTEQIMETAEASYLQDTVWAPGREGQLIQGLDGGIYHPYLAREIEDVQRALGAEGLYDGAVTGVLDQKTMEALAEYQRQQDLIPSGVPTPKTRELLNGAQGSAESSS